MTYLTQAADLLLENEHTLPALSFLMVVAMLVLIFGAFVYLARSGE